MNRLPVQNGGEDFLCLFIEPYCDVFWLKPGDEFTVVPADEVSDPQFTVVAVKHRLVVWIFEGGDPAKVIVDTRSSIARELSCRRATSGLLAGAHTDARVRELCLPDNPDKSRPDIQEPWTTARGCPGLPTLGDPAHNAQARRRLRTRRPAAAGQPGSALRESVQLHTGQDDVQISGVSEGDALRTAEMTVRAERHSVLTNLRRAVHDASAMLRLRAPMTANGYDIRGRQ